MAGQIGAVRQGKRIALQLTSDWETCMAKKNKYVIVRTYSAGVFAGELESRNGQEVVLLNARRLWYWKGAFTLSQLSQTGTTRPKECKFPAEVSRVVLLQAIEILDVSDAARKSIAEVPICQM
jgi:hypothetical protein